MDWIRLAQDRKRCRTVVNAVKKNSGSIKCMETLDRLRNYRLLKNDSVPWRLLTNYSL
jgi:hypothetical protein